jgi:hypothetical protein
MKNTTCNIFADDYLAAYGFARCHILSSSDNLNVWSIPANLPVPWNWPPPDYLKGQHYMTAHYVLPPFVSPPPYTCIPCRIQNNSYTDGCYSIHNLK